MVRMRSRRRYLAALTLTLAGAAFAADLRLPLRSRVEAFKGSGVWQEVRLDAALSIPQTAILICDMWDKHWCSGFYSDKQEIFDAIAVRELDTFRAGIERAFTARQLIFSPRKSLGRVLDAYVDFLESRPHFRELALGNHISESTRESQSDPQTGPGGILGDLLVRKCGWKPGKKLQLRIRIAAEAGDRVIAFAYRQESSEARQAVLKELKEMLTAYLLP